jgi:hypothetical protein
MALEKGKFLWTRNEQEEPNKTITNPASPIEIFNI